MILLTDPSPLSIRFAIPIAWDVLDRPPSPQRRELAAQTNAGVLAFLLQEVDIDAGPRPADEQLAEALAPLRLKLDMIIELLSRLSYRDIELPPQREIALAANHIVWQSPLPLSPGNWLRVRLYFHPTFREPIAVFGRVVKCDTGGGAGYSIHADLAEMPERILGDLARLAFLSERRQRAQRGK
ncbi:MAG TPA: hypothetical protein VE993_12555 [Stellaceae bacterium]|nr:hypothetical protein [Stellaceae bacterium]